jgi:hypothetical protein
MLQRGNNPQAIASYRESLGIAMEIGEKRGLVYCLEGLAFIDSTMGKFELATALLAFVEVFRKKIGSQLDAKESVEMEQYLTTIRAYLPPISFTNAWSKGEEMTIEQALALALEN